MTELEQIFAELNLELGLETPPVLFLRAAVWRRRPAERSRRPLDGGALVSRQENEEAERIGG